MQPDADKLVYPNEARFVVICSNLPCPKAYFFINIYYIYYIVEKSYIISIEIICLICIIKVYSFEFDLFFEEVPMK